MEKEILDSLKKVRSASRKLVSLTDEDIKQILNELADLTLANTSFILEENKAI